MNGCETYYKSITINATLNSRLMTDCQQQWWPEHTWKTFGYCSLLVNENNLVRQGNEIVRYRRQAQLVVGLAVVGYIVVCSAVTYAVVIGEKNSENAEKLKDAISDDRKTLSKALQALNSSSISALGLANSHDELNKRVTYVEETITDYPKVMATISGTFNYFEKIGRYLSSIDLEAAAGRASTDILKLTNETLWHRPAQQWSHLTHCKARNLTDGLMLFLTFTVPKIEKRISVLEADPISFWNKTENGEWCLMKYAGPGLVMLNETSSCLMHVHKHWLGNNAKTLEGHPCITPETGRKSFAELGGVYHKEKCRASFTPSQDDIVVKTNNGYCRIYCYGYTITIEGMSHQCPQFVFKLPYTTNFEVNGHEHTSKGKTLAYNDVAEFHVQDQIRAALKLDDMKIMKVDIGPIGKSVNFINKALNRLNETITLNQVNVPSMLEKPAQAITNVAKSVWNYLEVITLYCFIILALMIIVALSPLLHVIAVVVRVVRFALRRAIAKIGNIGHPGEDSIALTNSNSENDKYKHHYV